MTYIPEVIRKRSTRESLNHVMGRCKCHIDQKASIKNTALLIGMSYQSLEKFLSGKPIKLYQVEKIEKWLDKGDFHG